MENRSSTPLMPFNYPYVYPGYGYGGEMSPAAYRYPTNMYGYGGGAKVPARHPPAIQSSSDSGNGSAEGRLADISSDGSWRSDKGQPPVVSIPSSPSPKKRHLDSPIQPKAEKVRKTEVCEVKGKSKGKKSALADPNEEEAEEQNSDKKACALCGTKYKLTSTSGRGPLQEHIAKSHMQQPRWQCPHCPFKQWWHANGAMKLHMAVHHEDEEQEVADRAPELEESMREFLHRCFGIQSHANSGQGRKPGPVQKLEDACTLCGWKTHNKNLDKRYFHIITQHKDLLKDAVKCNTCDVGVRNLKEIKAHFAETHPDQEESYYDRREALKKSAHDRCFFKELL